ncbi:MAG: carboxypeptidase regulatory-like domain-containing protein, partial [Clostridia bacterium]|nr:carboxypeptidase regulatory-like domain-containing protein [Clostridia bacterium]
MMKRIKKAVVYIIAFAMCFGMVSFSPFFAYAEDLFEGGLGTESSPYEIKTAEQFGQINDSNAHLDKYFKLVENIDLSGFSGNPAIGTAVAPFVGSFDGNGKTISNLTIHRPEGVLPEYGVGLFTIGETGIVKDLTIQGASIQATGTAGILAGYNFGEIDNCHVQGSVTVTHNQQGAGGLVGENSGKIIDSSAQGTVSGNKEIGGLVGKNTFDSDSEGEIIDCFADVAVTGGNCVGGLVGINEKGDDNGAKTAKINVSYAKGNVVGDWQIGGLVGASNGDIFNCYAMGTVSESAEYGESGGLVGNSGGQIVNAYAIGFVDSSEATAGGLCGFNSGAISNSVYDQTTSGQSDTGKGMPKATNEMIALSTYSAWDFAHIWQKDGNTYPYFQWQSSNIPTVVIKYNLTFSVKDEENNPVENVSLTVDGQELFTNASGVAVFNLPNGSYSYTATKDGYVTAFGFDVMINNKDTSSSVILHESEVIQYVEFEDPDLLWLVIANGGDKDGDGKICVTEALLVTSLHTSVE